MLFSQFLERQNHCIEGRGPRSPPLDAKHCCLIVQDEANMRASGWAEFPESQEDGHQFQKVDVKGAEER